MFISARGVLLAIAIYSISWILFNCVYTWMVILLCVLRRLIGDKCVKPLLSVFTRLSDYIKWWWFIVFTFLFEVVLGVRYAFTVVDGYGEKHMKSRYLSPYGRSKVRKLRPDLAKIFAPPSKPGKVKIISLNHHSRVDWIYFAIFLIRSHAFYPLRFILKNNLRHIPILGWSMDAFGFMFLSRSWESDKAYLQSMINYNKSINEAYTLIIFPEGTDLSPSNVAKSQVFARDNGMPTFYHVLNPRTTGLVGLKNMIGPENIEEIIDCTIGYTYGASHQRPDELSLVNGSHSHKVHLLIRSYTFQSLDAEPNTDVGGDAVVPTGDHGFSEWIHRRFAEKEQLLSRFYRNDPVGYDAADVREVCGEHCAVESFDCDEYYGNPTLPLSLFSVSPNNIYQAFSQIWWMRVGVVLGFYSMFFFMMWYINWKIFLMFCVISTIVFVGFLKVVKNVQQALFL